jgi:hypothetical protein
VSAKPASGQKKASGGPRKFICVWDFIHENNFVFPSRVGKTINPCSKGGECDHLHSSAYKNWANENKFENLSRQSFLKNPGNPEDLAALREFFGIDESD